MGEMKGDMDELLNMERELLMHMGFGKFYNNDMNKFPEGDYVDVANKYNVKEIDNAEENRLKEEYGPVYMLKNFPLYTSPFWNMKMNGDISDKVDVIMGGQETIGSAERSCDKEVMRDMFMNISEGKYKEILFNKFGEKRVLKELDQFLSYDFFKRSGGGIGVTRMMSALEKSNLLEKGENVELFKEVCEKSGEKLNIKESSLNL